MYQSPQYKWSALTTAPYGQTLPEMDQYKHYILTALHVMFALRAPRQVR